MKTMIKMLALVAWCGSLNLNAAISDQVEMEITGTSSFKLVMDQVSQKVQIQLKDEFGYSLHKEAVIEDA